MPFHKVLFSRSGFGTTAGLVVDSNLVDVRDVVAVSRVFPRSAAPYMRTCHVSPAYPSWDLAFAHVFPINIEGSEV